MSSGSNKGCDVGSDGKTASAVDGSKAAETTSSSDKVNQSYYLKRLEDMGYSDQKAIECALQHHNNDYHKALALLQEARAKDLTVKAIVAAKKKDDSTEKNNGSASTAADDGKKTEASTDAKASGSQEAIEKDAATAKEVVKETSDTSKKDAGSKGIVATALRMALATLKRKESPTEDDSGEREVKQKVGDADDSGMAKSTTESADAVAMAKTFTPDSKKPEALSDLAKAFEEAKSTVNAATTGKTAETAASTTTPSTGNIPANTEIIDDSVDMDADDSTAQASNKERRKWPEGKPVGGHNNSDGKNVDHHKSDTIMAKTTDEAMACQALQKIATSSSNTLVAARDPRGSPVTSQNGFGPTATTADIPAESGTMDYQTMKLLAEYKKNHCGNGQDATMNIIDGDKIDSIITAKNNGAQSDSLPQVRTQHQVFRWLQEQQSSLHKKLEYIGPNCNDAWLLFGLISPPNAKELTENLKSPKLTDAAGMTSIQQWLFKHGFSFQHPVKLFNSSQNDDGMEIDEAVSDSPRSGRAKRDGAEIAEANPLTFDGNNQVKKARTESSGSPTSSNIDSKLAFFKERWEDIKKLGFPLRQGVLFQHTSSEETYDELKNLPSMFRAVMLVFQQMKQYRDPDTGKLQDFKSSIALMKDTLTYFYLRVALGNGPRVSRNRATGSEEVCYDTIPSQDYACAIQLLGLCGVPPRDLIGLGLLAKTSNDVATTGSSAETESSEAVNDNSKQEVAKDEDIASPNGSQMYLLHQGSLASFLSKVSKESEDGMSPTAASSIGIIRRYFQLETEEQNEIPPRIINPPPPDVDVPSRYEVMWERIQALEFPSRDEDVVEPVCEVHNLPSIESALHLVMDMKRLYEDPITGKRHFFNRTKKTPTLTRNVLTYCYLRLAVGTGIVPDTQLDSIPLKDVSTFVALMSLFGISTEALEAEEILSCQRPTQTLSRRRRSSNASIAHFSINNQGSLSRFKLSLGGKPTPTNSAHYVIKRLLQLEGIEGWDMGNSPQEVVMTSPPRWTFSGGAKEVHQNSGKLHFIPAGVKKNDYWDIRNGISLVLPFSSHNKSEPSAKDAQFYHCALCRKEFAFSYSLNRSAHILRRHWDQHKNGVLSSLPKNPQSTLSQAGTPIKGYPNSGFYRFVPAFAKKDYWNKDTGLSLVYPSKDAPATTPGARDASRFYCAKCDMEFTYSTNNGHHYMESHWEKHEKQKSSNGAAPVCQQWALSSATSPEIEDMAVESKHIPAMEARAVLEEWCKGGRKSPIPTIAFPRNKLRKQTGVSSSPRNKKFLFNKVVIRKTQGLGLGLTKYFFVLDVDTSNNNPSLILIPMSARGVLRGKLSGELRYKCDLLDTTANWIVGKSSDYVEVNCIAAMKTAYIHEEAWGIGCGTRKDIRQGDEVSALAGSKVPVKSVEDRFFIPSRSQNDFWSIKNGLSLVWPSGIEHPTSKDATQYHCALCNKNYTFIEGNTSNMSRHWESHQESGSRSFEDEQADMETDIVLSSSHHPGPQENTREPSFVPTGPPIIPKSQRYVPKLVRKDYWSVDSGISLVAPKGKTDLSNLSSKNASQFFCAICNETYPHDFGIGHHQMSGHWKLHEAQDVKAPVEYTYRKRPSMDTKVAKSKDIEVSNVASSKPQANDEEAFEVEQRTFHFIPLSSRKGYWDFEKGLSLVYPFEDDPEEPDVDLARRFHCAICEKEYTFTTEDGPQWMEAHWQKHKDGILDPIPKRKTGAVLEDSGNHHFIPSHEDSNKEYWDLNKALSLVYPSKYAPAGKEPSIRKVKSFYCALCKGEFPCDPAKGLHPRMAWHWQKHQKIK